MIRTNLEKAKEITKENLRTLRDPLLKQLDIDYIKALESGNTQIQTEIVNKKNLLRNITKTDELLNATTEKELKELLQTGIKI